MKNILTYLAITLLTLVAPAQGSKEKVYEFPNPSSKLKSLATIKFEENKDHVLITFEGTGLKKGKYKVLQLQKCAQNTKMKKMPSDKLIEFQINYGDISTEHKIADSTIAGLNLDRSQIALVKSDNLGNTIVGCAVSNSTIEKTTN